MTALSERVLPFLIDNTVRSTVLLALAAIVVLLSRRASASFRHLVWALALGCVMCLPLLSQALPHWQVAMKTPASPPRQAGVKRPDASAPPSQPIKVTPESTQAALSTSAPLPTSMPVSPLPLPTQPAPVRSTAVATVPWGTWAILVWGVGALLVLARTARALVNLRAVEGASARVDDKRMVEALAVAEQVMRVERTVALLIGSPLTRVTVPITWGVLRPVVLLPAEAAAWPEDKMRAALLHEMAHVRRCGWLLQTFVHLACAFHWFNPFIWLAARRMRAESETACDDLVLSAGVPAADYARHLLEVALYAREQRRISSGAVAMAQTPKIEERLRTVLATGLSREAITRRIALGALAAAFMVALPLAALRIGARAQGQWSSLPVVTDANHLQLHEGFTLRYAVTITDLTSSKMQQHNYQQLRAGYQKLLKKDPYFQPVPADYYAPFSYYQSHRNKIRHAVITVSTFRGRLVYQKEEEGETFSLTYNGEETRQSINHQATVIETGFDFAGMENIPMPAVGIPYVPLLTQVKLLHGSDSQQTWLAECPQIGSAGYRGAPWIEPDTVRAIRNEGAWKVTDIDNGAGEWQYLRHQRFQGLWIASEMRYTHYVSDPTLPLPPPSRFSSYEEGNRWIDSTRIPTQSCDYHLISASNDWLVPGAVSSSAETTTRDKQSLPNDDTSRFKRIEDLYVQGALHLRYHLQGWAGTHKALLQQSEKAIPSDKSFLAKRNQSLNVLPFPLWQGDPRSGHVWDGDPRIGHDGQKPLFEAEHPTPQDNPASRDFEIARSLNPGRVHIVLWASGRVTRNTAQGTKGTGTQQEVVPAFFGADGTSNMAGDGPEALKRASSPPSAPQLNPAVGFRRYTSPPLPDGTRYTFLYPSYFANVHQGWLDTDHQFGTVRVDCVGTKPVPWIASPGQASVAYYIHGKQGASWLAPHEEFCSVVAGSAAVPFWQGLHPLEIDHQWVGEYGNHHDASIKDAHTRYRFELIHEDRYTPALFKQTDPVIFKSFRVLPPGASVPNLPQPAIGAARTTAGMITGGNDTATAHIALGQKLQDKGQPRDGIPEFRRAVQLDPNNAEAQSDLAQALYEIKWKHFRTPLGDKTVGFGTPPALLDEAILHMRQAVALRPIDARLHSSLATYLSNRGHHREAVAEYRRAMHLMPPLSPADIKPSTDGSISGTVQPWYDAYWTLGEELVKTGQYQEAVINLRQALRFNPSSDSNLLWLGDALNGSGHRAEARAAWRESLAARPPNSYYQRQARARLARH